MQYVKNNRKCEQNKKSRLFTEDKKEKTNKCMKRSLTSFILRKIQLENNEMQFYSPQIGKKINKFDYTKYWRAHGLMDILNMFWKNINWCIHQKNKFVLSFKFKHSHTPSRKECQRIKTKQNNPACTNRWTNEIIRHLQIIPENCTNFLWMELKLHVYAEEKEK